MNVSFNRKARGACSDLNCQETSPETKWKQLQRGCASSRKLKKYTQNIWTNREDISTTEASYTIFRLTVMFVTFIVIKWHCEITAFSVVEKDSGSIANAHAWIHSRARQLSMWIRTCTKHWSWKVILLLRTRTKTMVKLEFGAIARR